MHFAFTPEVENSGIPGAIAYGSHFYSWCRLTDTIRGIYRIRITDARITNGDHKDSWYLLARMLLRAKELVGSGSKILPDHRDLGAILTLILRHEDFKFVPRTPELKKILHVVVSRARTLLEKARLDIPEVYEAWEKEDKRVSGWIENKTDLTVEEISKLGLN